MLLYGNYECYINYSVPTQIILFRTAGIGCGGIWENLFKVDFVDGLLHPILSLSFLLCLAKHFFLFEGKSKN